MATKKVTELTALAAGSVATATDVIPISDVSETESKKITVADLLSLAPVGAITRSAKTANYTLTDADDVIEVDGSGGAFNLTLHDPATAKKKLYIVKRTENAMANPVSLVGTIDGSTDNKLHTIYESWGIYPNGTEWKKVFHNTETELPSPSITIGASVTPPTIGTTTVNILKAFRRGSFLEVNWHLNQSAGGNNGSGVYLFPLPYSLAVDSVLYPSGVYNHGGTGMIDSNWVYYNGSVVAKGAFYVYDANNLWGDAWSGANGLTHSAGFFASAAGAFSFNYKIKINGWKD